MRIARKPSLVTADIEIARLISETYDDPYAFVRLAYPWGEPGELAGFSGPDLWQREVLEDLGREVRARAFDGVQAVAPIVSHLSRGWIECEAQTAQAPGAGLFPADAAYCAESGMVARFRARSAGERACGARARRGRYVHA
jgi:hypothetical protein